MSSLHRPDVQAEFQNPRYEEARERVLGLEKDVEWSKSKVRDLEDRWSKLQEDIQKMRDRILSLEHKMIYHTVAIVFLSAVTQILIRAFWT